MNTLSSSLEQERSKNKQLKAELVKLQVCGDEGFGDVELVVWHKWIPCVCSVLFTVFAGVPRERAVTTNRPINANTFFLCDDSCTTIDEFCDNWTPWQSFKL